MMFGQDMPAMASSSDVMQRQDEMEGLDLPEDLKHLPADLEDDVPESRDFAFLLNNEGKLHYNQDFCEGAEFDYSLPASGHGSYSPQMITASDVPGWVDPNEVNDENMNVFDCMEKDLLNNKFWTDISVKEDNEMYLERDSFGAPSSGISPPLSPLQTFGSSCWTTAESLGKPFKHEAIPECAQAPSLKNCFNNDVEVLPVSPQTSPDYPPVYSFDDDVPYDTPSYEAPNVMYDEAPIVTIEDEPISDSFFDEPSNGTLDEEISFLGPKSVKAEEPVPAVASPRIIRVAISEVFKQKAKFTVLQNPSQITSSAPQVSFQTATKKINPKIIYLKKVSVPMKPNVKQEPMLKDVISGDGDELLRELTQAVEPEPSTSYDADFSVSYGAEPSSYDMDEDYQPSTSRSFASRKRSAPYSKDERKLRKKEQNKRAAIKYREKKKDEVGALAEELAEMERVTAEDELLLKKLEMELELVRSLVKDKLKVMHIEFMKNN